MSDEPFHAVVCRASPCGGAAGPLLHMLRAAVRCSGQPEPRQPDEWRDAADAGRLASCISRVATHHVGDC